MVRKIEAYECESTGAIYKTERAAVEAQFREMMQSAAGSMPYKFSDDFEGTEVVRWLSNIIVSETYPTVLPKLLSALEFYREHRMGRS